MTKRWNIHARSYIAILLLCFVLFVQNNNKIALPNIIQDTITLSLGVLYEALPFVFLGILISTAVQIYIPSTALLKILPKNNMTRRAILSVSGSFMPVCECGNVPLARGLMMKGIRPQDALTFVLAAPIINPVTALTTWQAFPANPAILFIRLLSAFTIANLVGWLFDTRSKQTLITESFHDHCDAQDASDKKKSKKLSSALMSSKISHHISKFARRFQSELSALLPSLVGGSLIAGLIQTLVPRSILLSVASEPVLAILTMIALAFVVSICANVDAFFALSLSGIFPVSAIIAFLVFGPMIDIKILSMLRTTYRVKTLINTTIIVLLSTLCVGLVVHYVV